VTNQDCLIGARDELQEIHHGTRRALDKAPGPEASRIKRGDHSFTEPTQLETFLRDSRSNAVHVETVEQMIVFLSMLDCVRFQLRTGENWH
jgi:hypothetical protein